MDDHKSKDSHAQIRVGDHGVKSWTPLAEEAMNLNLNPTENTIIEIILTDDEKKRLQELRQTTNQCKVNFADAARSVVHATLLRDHLLEKCDESMRDLEEQIQSCALARGIDLTNREHGRWDFNFDTGRFKRVD